MLQMMQVAVAVIVMCHGLSVALSQWRLIDRPTGLVEAELLTLRSHPINGTLFPANRSDADLKAIRSLPGVVAASRVNYLPLSDHGWRSRMRRLEGGEPVEPGVHSGILLGDANLPETLGLRLLSGRPLAAEAETPVSSLTGLAREALVTRALAVSLFDSIDVIGQSLHHWDGGAVTIVGVVEHVQSAWVDWEFHDNSVILPAHYERDEAFYVVRIAPGQRQSVTNALRPTLLALDPARVVTQPEPYGQIRAHAYAEHRMLVIWSLLLALGLLLITALGMYANASIEAARRHREIGLRRAVGASQSDVFRHVYLHITLIMIGGCSVGLTFALIVNRMLSEVLDLPPPSIAWFGVCAVVTLVCCAAAYGPARRAASVAPAQALRGE